MGVTNFIGDAMTQQNNKKSSHEVSVWDRIKSFVYFVVRQVFVMMFVRLIKNGWWEDV